LSFGPFWVCLFFFLIPKFFFWFCYFFLMPHCLLGLLFFLNTPLVLLFIFLNPIFCWVCYFFLYLFVFWFPPPLPLYPMEHTCDCFLKSYQTKDFKKRIEVLFSIKLEQNFSAFWLAIVEILNCWNFKHIWTIIIHQQECGSFILVGFLNWNGASAKISHGWWLWLSKTWTFIKWSTFMWMLWLP